MDILNEKSISENKGGEVLICLKKYRYVILFAVLALLTMAFIFGNSLKNGEASNAISTGIAEKLLNLLRTDREIDMDLFHKLVRKAAHFTEFAVFGIFLTLFMFSVEKLTGHCHLSAVFFTALATAVTDEFIQNFTGRSSMVSDVLIDFSGAVTGILLVSLILWLIRYRKTVSV